MALFIFVEITDSTDNIIHEYWMNYRNTHERYVLGQQCSLAFNAGQRVYTCPVAKFGEYPQ